MESVLSGDNSESFNSESPLGKFNISGITLKEYLEDNLTAVFISGVDGKIFMCNQAFVKMFGFSSVEEAMNSNIVSIYSSKQRREQFLEIIRNKKRVESYEMELVKKDGEPVFILCNIIGEFDEQGVLKFLRGYLFDITKRVTAQAEIIQLNRLYSVLSSINGLIVRTRDRKVLFDESCRIAVEVGKYEGSCICECSPDKKSLSLISAFGQGIPYTNNLNSFFEKYPTIFDKVYKILSDDDYLVISPTFKDPVTSQLHYLLSAIKDRTLIILSLKKFGRLVGFFYLFSTFDKISEKELSHFKELSSDLSFAIGYFEQIEQSEKAQEALKDSEHKLRNAEKLGRIGNWEYDLRTKSIRWSDQVYNLYRRDKALGPPSVGEQATYYSVEQHKMLLQYAKEAIKSKKSFEYELNVTFPDGSISVFNATLIPVTDHTDKVVKLFGTVQDITDRKLAADALIKSDQRYREVVEEAVEIIFTTDASGNFTYANPAAIKSSGYSLPELHNIRYLDLIVSDYRRKVSLNYLRQFKDKIDVTYMEYPFYTKSGEIKWFGQNARLIIEANLIKGFHVIARDITARKLAEEALNESEKKYSTLFENVQDVFYQVDLKGNIIDISPSIKHFSNFNRDDLIGKSVFNLYADVSDRQEFLANILRNGEVKDYEVKFKSGDGNLVYTSINAQIVNDASGNPHHIDGSIRDITDRVTAELELRKLKRAIEQSSISIVIADLNGNIEYVNPYFEKLTGFSFTEVVGQNTRILKSNNHNASFYKLLWDTITSGKVWNGEFLNKKKNGELYWSNAIISPISNNGKKVTHYVSIQEDISEKKKIIEELVLAKEKADEANRLKSIFLANMSHELRTPLVAILGYAELLSEEAPSSVIKEMSSTILLSGRRLLDTLNSILDISSIESNRKDLRITTVDVIEVINESINLYRPSIKAKQLYIKSSFPDKPVYINSDPDLLSKIINNLISNAMKYTDKGGIAIILSDSSINTNTIKISFIDTGIGINKEYHSLIFEPFRQASEGLSRKFEGTGLGLTITKKLVTLLDGSISLQSEPGKGSTFSVKLPVQLQVRKSVKEIEETQDNFENVSLPVLPTNVKILLVEDDPSNAGIIESYLNNYAAVEHVFDGPTALDLCKQKKYDVILMDINLKGISGVETLNRIRLLDEINAKVPVIAITAYAMKGDKEKFLSLGFSEYISKPFTKSHLLNSLNLVLNKVLNTQS